MDFEFSSEQAMLKDSVDRLIAERYQFEARKGFLAQPEGWSRDNWNLFAELGLLGLPFDEADGGFGGGPVETMIVMEAFGRGLVLEPYLSCVMLGGSAVRYAFGEAHRMELVPGIADGSLLVGFAHAEERARYNLSFVETTANRQGGGWVLNGRKTDVLNGGAADLLVVSARSAGEPGDETGISLFAVPAGHPGLHVTPYARFDGTRAAAIDCDGLALGADALLGEAGGAFPAIERIVEAGIAAVCAEAVGVMDAMLSTTVGYIKTRNQFGGPLGRFQALQHRAAEMYVALEQARSMAIYAAMMVVDNNAIERRRALSAAKVQIGKSARFVGQQAIQLHGGIGITEEYVVGHHFRRTTMIERQFGDVEHHLGVLDELGGLYGAVA